MIVNGKSDGKTWPPGPYTEEQLAMLERGWHGRPTFITVVAEIRRLMTVVAKIHDQMDQTDPRCPVGIALTKAHSLTRPSWPPPEFP
jgi:hypothetical protein